MKKKGSKNFIRLMIFYAAERLLEAQHVGIIFSWTIEWAKGTLVGPLQCSLT